jgi:hypothetical protein
MKTFPMLKFDSSETYVKVSLLQVRGLGHRGGDQQGGEMNAETNAQAASLIVGVN